MKLLLTSAGIKNPSIREALVDLLGKPIADSNALCIPTAAYGSSYSTPAGPWRFISGRSEQPMTGHDGPPVWRSLRRGSHMTTTVAPHPADAPPRDGVAPHVTIGEETALVTYAFEHELVSELLRQLVIGSECSQRFLDVLDPLAERRIGTKAVCAVVERNSKCNT